MDCFYGELYINGVPFMSIKDTSLNFCPIHTQLIPNITHVVYNDPATIVFWEDGTKTVVKCQKEKGDTYSKETGLAMAIAKKVYGNKGNFNDVFTKWLGE